MVVLFANNIRYLWEWVDKNKIRSVREGSGLNNNGSSGRVKKSDSEFLLTTYII